MNWRHGRVFTCSSNDMGFDSRLGQVELFPFYDTYFQNMFISSGAITAIDHNARILKY